MFTSKVALKILKKAPSYATLENGKRVQATLIGAASELGQNIALLMRQNYKITHLNLYDDSPVVQGVATELRSIPGGPVISAYVGEHELPFSILKSDVIIMAARTHRHPGQNRQQLLLVNSPAVLQLCMAVARYNRKALIGISTNPINCIIPFACKVLQQLGYYNPFKILGITQIDVDRTLTYTSQMLNVDINILDIPVIGGHSEHTILPLFSNTKPKYLSIESAQADALTKVIQKSGTDVVSQKQGTESSTLAMAWSVNTFADKLVDAVLGDEVKLHAFTANPNYKTRFFSGPTQINSTGVIGPARGFEMNNDETTLLNTVISKLNKDIVRGEEHVSVLEDRIRSEYFS